METSAQTVPVHAAEIGGLRGRPWLSHIRSRTDVDDAKALSGVVPQPGLEGYLQALAQLAEVNQQLQARLDTEQSQAASLRTQLEQLRREALTDPLTGLFNRRAFDQRLNHVWQKSGEGRLAVLLLDIDFFKRINHTYGYAGGDSVIRWVAETLRLFLRDPDCAFRFSGEKFLVLLQDRSIIEAARIPEGIRARIERNRLSCYRNRSELLTISIGVAARKSQDDPLSLFARVDRALCMAKRGGRNRVMRET